MSDARNEIIINSRKVHIRNAFAKAVLANHRRNVRVVRVVDARKQVVLYLVVQASIHET